MEQELNADAPEQQPVNSAHEAHESHEPETVNPQPEAPAAPEPPAASEPPATSETPAAPDVDLEAMLAEAEQRGYLRGRNEAIAETRNEPGLWQIAASPDADTVGGARHPVEILREIRPSVWD